MSVLLVVAVVFALCTLGVVWVATRAPLVGPPPHRPPKEIA